MHPDATPGRPGWVLVENEGALFRGRGRSFPAEVWNPGVGWQPYAGRDRSRSIAWGYDIDAEEASALMTALDVHHLRREAAKN